MDIPTDRLLIMIIAATGFAVIPGGWAAAYVHAEATGWEALALRVAIGVVVLAVLIGLWFQFASVEEETT